VTISSPSKILPLPQDDPRVSDGLYTVREAAGFLQLPPSTLQRWASRGGHDGSLVQTLPVTRGAASMTFVGLSEAYILRALRSTGVPLQRIRPALDRLRTDIGIDYALASGHLFSDGSEILFDYLASDAGDRVLRSLTVVRSGQTVFVPIVRDYLKQIEWDSSSWPVRLHLKIKRAQVVVDSERAFGRPILVHGGARIEDLADRWLGGDDLKEIARDYGVPAYECEDAVRAYCQTRRAA
jgi:uncharacterized protein (DUF433 family)